MGPWAQLIGLSGGQAIKRTGGKAVGGPDGRAVGRLGTGIVCGSSSEYRVNSCVNFGPFSGPEFF